MSQGVCYIIGAGAHFPSDRPVPGPNDLLIAADGGYAWCRERGLKPDLVVGDFDSLGEAPAGEHVLRLPVEKDDTDSSAAIRLGRERGYAAFFLFGCTGGRFDHSLANLQLLSGLAQTGARGYLFGENEVCTVIRDSALRFGPECRGTLSVFALSEVCRGVSERGLKYRLDRAELRFDFPLGVSNSFTGRESEISVEEGLLAVLYPKDVWHQ